MDANVLKTDFALIKALYDHENVLISTSVRPLTVKNDLQ